MRHLLQKLPFPVEFAVVVAGAFGYFAVASALSFAPHHAAVTGLTELAVWHTVGFKAIVLAVLGLFLWGRGWTGARFGLDSDWKDGLWALPLAVACFAAMYAAAVVVAILVPGVVPHDIKPAPPSLTPYAVGALVLLNAFYEEFFAAGYVVTALKDKGLPNVAINLGVAIRLAAHLSQGVVAVVVVVPMGLLFGTLYVRTGRLWPLILAHTLFYAWSYAQYIKW